MYFNLRMCFKCIGWWFSSKTHPLHCTVQNAFEREKYFYHGLDVNRAMVMAPSKWGWLIISQKITSAHVWSCLLSQVSLLSLMSEQPIHLLYFHTALLHMQIFTYVFVLVYFLTRSDPPKRWRQGHGLKRWSSQKLAILLSILTFVLQYIYIYIYIL